MPSETQVGAEDHAIPADNGINSYLSIEGGWPEYPLAQIIGVSATAINTWDSTLSASSAAWVANAVQSGEAVTAGTGSLSNDPDPATDLFGGTPTWSAATTPQPVRSCSSTPGDRRTRMTRTATNPARRRDLTLCLAG